MSLIRRKDPGQAWETEEDTGGGGQSMYVQPNDPGAVGAGKFWLDTSAIVGYTFSALKIRNETNADWHAVTSVLYDAGPPERIQVVSLASSFLTIQSQNLTSGQASLLTIAEGFKNQWATPAGGEIAIGDVGGLLSFFGQNPGTTQPVVPQTTPGIQDVIDALVLLGLVAQHD